MRSNYFYSIMFLFSIIFIILIGTASANPIIVQETIVEEGGEIEPESDTPLILKSENITFDIGNNVNALGRYTIYNPTTQNITQKVLFPIYRHKFNTYFNPGLFEFHILNVYWDIDNNSGEDVFIKYSEPVSGFVDGFDSEFEYITFDLSLPPQNTSDLVIRWRQFYSINKPTGAELCYITETAKAWPRSIEYAHFEFIFRNYTILGEPEGGDNVFYRDGDVITTIERTNWVPESDIRIAWETTMVYFEFTRGYTYNFFIQAGPVLDENNNTLKGATIRLYDRNNEFIYLMNNEGLNNEYLLTDNQGIVRFGIAFRAGDYTRNTSFDLVIEKPGYYKKVIGFEPDTKTFVAENIVLEKAPDEKEESGFLPGFTVTSILLAIFFILFYRRNIHGR